MTNPIETRYPLLQEILDLMGLALQPMYSNLEVAMIFSVKIRTIQAYIEQGKLVRRDLPGRKTFLPSDLEEYLVNSRRKRSGK